MTDNERAVIEAAVEWERIGNLYGLNSTPREKAAWRLSLAVSELHNEHDGKWRPSHD